MEDFSSFTFCFSGIDEELAVELLKKIEANQGRHTKDFSNHVTHLVCLKAGSAKYKAARKLDIKIVLPQFIDGHQEGLVQELQGLVVSTTGYSGKELDEIIAKINTLNGIYSADMTRKTDLLLSNNQNSQKAKAAKDWGIETRSKEFIFKFDLPKSFFENTKIYLGKGFDPELRDYLRQIIRLGGGNFMTTFSSIVTHYITTGSEELNIKCEVVNYKWLSECFLKSTLLDTLPYKLQKKKVEMMKPLRKVFYKLEFKISGYKEEEVCKTNKDHVLRESISEYGGKIVTGKNSDYHISPFVHFKNHHKKNTATEFWVESCIQSGKILELDELTLYTPTKHQLAKFPYLIGITGFLDNDRIWIHRICNALGMGFTENLSKNNTHLIAKEIGTQKAIKAKEWGIPIENMDWLYSLLEETTEAEENGRNDVDKHVHEQVLLN
jgi:NAD-dependent DNA ligase